MHAHEDERDGALFLWMWRGKKGNEVVNVEDDGIGSSGCMLQSPQLASLAFDFCVISEGFVGLFQPWTSDYRSSESIIYLNRVKCVLNNES